MLGMLVTFAGLLALDGITTWYVVRYGGSEANPAFRFIGENWHAFALLKIVGFFLVAHKVTKEGGVGKMGKDLVFLSVISAAFAAVCAWNVYNFTVLV